MAGSVHVVGAAGAAETLVALLADFQKDFGIGQVTFHKRSVTPHDRARLKALTDRGAVLTVDKEQRPLVDELKLEAGPDASVALANAQVIVDCTPFADRNKDALYVGLQSTRGFVALHGGSGFGVPLCQGVNHASLRRGSDRFLRVPDAASHAMASIVQALSNNGKSAVEDASFVCLRRGMDVCSGAELVAGPAVRLHDDGEFGTDAARQAHEVLHSAGVMCGLSATDVELNTQLLDVIHFRVRLKENIAAGEAVRRLTAQSRLGMTEVTSSHPVFGFARDNGYLGRMFNALVVSRPTVRVHRNNEVVGAAFVPDEGTSLFSALAAILWLLESEHVARRLDALKPFVFAEV